MMMKLSRRYLCALLAVIMLATCFFAGCGEKKEEEEKKSPNMGLKGELPWIELDWKFKTGNEVTWDFVVAGPGYGTATERVVAADAPIQNWDFGDGVYQNVYEGVSAAQYKELIDKLKTAGYQVYSEGNLNGDAYYTLLTYQTNVYNVTYFANIATAYVTASAERPLSPHLLQDNASTQSEALPGMDAKLTMLDWQEGGGDNYIIQLKNGHFILFDGGNYQMFKQTLEFMEANTPEGQTPVVEAWFLTHGHYDHVGWTQAFYGSYSDTNGMFYNGEAGSRVIVNGIYWNQTNTDVIEHTIYGWRSDGYRNKTESVWAYRVQQAAEKMLTADGQQTPIYRPQTGQTFYFKDLTVEVPYTQEHITFANYQMDINAASTWYLIRAEGKTFLDAGDTENVNLEQAKRMYTADYEIYRPNVMSAFHHGHNIYSQLIDTYRAPIIFYTSKTMFTWAAEYTQANKDMLSMPNTTYYCYGDGAYQYNFATGEVSAK
jgi:beta-lactamase superfamily II metal-dependent hydrolase